MSILKRKSPTFKIHGSSKLIILLQHYSVHCYRTVAMLFLQENFSKDIKKECFVLHNQNAFTIKTVNIQPLWQWSIKKLSLTLGQLNVKITSIKG